MRHRPGTETLRRAADFDRTAPLHNKWPHLAFMLALGAVLLVSAALSLWTIGHVKDAVVAAALGNRPLTVAAIKACLDVTDLILAVLLLIAVAVLVWMEVSRRAATRFLREATGREAFCVLTMIVAWTGHAYLFPGVLLGGDTATYISRFLEVQRGIEAGSLPFWTNYQYMGEPLLWFTGPLTYVVGGALSVLFHDPTAAAKCFLFVFHVLAGWLFFVFARRIGARPVAAMVSAALFSGCFANLHLFFYRGVMPQAITIALTVALFHGADGLLRGKGRRSANAALFALSTCGLIVNHQPHALFAAAYLALFGAVAAAVGFWRIRQLPVLAAAGILGVLAASIAILPTVAEAQWVMIEATEQPFHFHLPTMTRLLHLVAWRNTRTTWGLDYWAYLGLGLVACALAGLILLLTRRTPARGAALPSACCLAVCLFLYDPVVRDIIYLMFFAAILASTSVDRLLATKGRFPVLIIAVIFIDLASTAIQPVARTDKDFLVQAGQRLESIAPDQRSVQVAVAADGTLLADMGPDNTAMSYSALFQRLAGDHNMAATGVHNYAVTLIKQAEADLASTAALQASTARLLAMFNVGRITCYTPVANGCPDRFKNEADDPVLGRFIPIPGATPVLFSQALARVEGDPARDKPMLWDGDFEPPDNARPGASRDALRDWLAIEDPDLATRQAKALAVQALPLGAAAPSADPAWHAVLTRYAVGIQDVTIAVSADQPGFVQLANPWFPPTQVTVNGQAIAPIRGTINFLVLPIDRGDSVIRLRPAFTWIERASAAASLAGLIGIGLLSALLERKPKAAA